MGVASVFRTLVCRRLEVVEVEDNCLCSSDMRRESQVDWSDSIPFKHGWSKRHKQGVGKRF
jgi:hypothetical protein